VYTLYFKNIIFTKYYLGDEIKKDEGDGTCCTYGAEEKCLQGFGGETSRKETPWKT
jgi:hypothetical protein